MENTARAITPEIIAFPNQNTLTDRQIDNRVKKLAELEAETKRIKKEIDSLKAEIKSAMSGDELTTANWIIKNTVYDRVTIDSKRLKADFPEVYRECSKTSQSSRFSYKEV